MTELDWEDIQGNILRGYGFDYGRHLVLRVTSPRAAREWLADLVPTITPATPWTVRPALTLNMAFTCRGLTTLGVDGAALASFPETFRHGMAYRAARHLGDVGADGPDCWESPGIHAPDAHVLLMVQGIAADRCAERAEELLGAARASGLELVSTERLANLRMPDDEYGSHRRMEHFGFADGISQPAVAGAVEPTTIPGHGTALKAGRWRPVAAGEFILGYPDEEEQKPELPGPEPLVRNGSFLVYRKLAQDVAAFRRFVAETSQRHAVADELVAAKLVGRRPDGTPLLPPGHRPPPGDGGLNDVRYQPDAHGMACPIGSHIRRANPRDALGFKPELVSRHRLLRRGMPYGPTLPEGETVDDGVARGLLFMAYCASISRQFEVVQREWLNDGNVFGVGRTPDPLVGGGSAPRRFVCHVPGRRPLILSDLPRFVRPVTGEYLFQPGLTALHHLLSAG